MAVDSTTVNVYNVTGTNILVEASYIIGSNIEQTPGQLDFDGDGNIEIIVMNSTHMITLEHNGTSLNLENASAHSTTFGTSIFLSYPVIKCAPGTVWEDGEDRCVTWTSEFFQLFSVYSYELDNNVVQTDSLAYPLKNLPGYSITIDDLDNDGYYEMIFSGLHAATLYKLVYKAEINSTGGISAIQLDLVTGGYVVSDYSTTDIIVNNLDGTRSDGLEITYGYTSDGTNWNAITLNADGTTAVSSYCSTLTCPEGEMISTNLFEAGDTQYSDFSNDVCYYVRNSQNNDPGLETDTIMCLSLSGGADRTETEISNTQNFTTYFNVHKANLYGSSGVITSLFGVQGLTKQTYPQISQQGFAVPVDYQKTGTLDVIVIGDGFIDYYDDAYTNQQVVITGLAFDTGNPVCQNEIVGFTLSLTDNENDNGYCHIEETYANGTVITNHSNTSFTTPSDITLNYFADSTGSYFLNFVCRDQYSTESSTQETYTISVSNDTSSCNYKGVGGSSIGYTTTEEDLADEQFDDAIDEAMSDLGITSQSGKTLFWLVLTVGILFLMFPIVSKMKSGVGIMLSSVMLVMLIMGWFLGFIGISIIAIIGLLLSVFLTVTIMTAMRSNGG